MASEGEMKQMAIVVSAFKEMHRGENYQPIHAVYAAGNYFQRLADDKELDHSERMRYTYYAKWLNRGGDAWVIDQLRDRSGYWASFNVAHVTDSSAPEFEDPHDVMKELVKAQTEINRMYHPDQLLDVPEPDTPLYAEYWDDRFKVADEVHDKNESLISSVNDLVLTLGGLATNLSKLVLEIPKWLRVMEELSGFVTRLSPTLEWAENWIKEYKKIETEGDEAWKQIQAEMKQKGLLSTDMASIPVPNFSDPTFVDKYTKVMRAKSLPLAGSQISSQIDTAWLMMKQAQSGRGYQTELDAYHAAPAMGTTGENLLSLPASAANSAAGQIPHWFLMTEDAFHDIFHPRVHVDMDAIKEKAIKSLREKSGN